MKPRMPWALLLLGVFLVGWLAPQAAFAMAPPGSRLAINGQMVDVTPGLQQRSGLTTLPLGPVLNALGAQVHYNAAKGTLTATLQGRSLTLEAGNPYASADGRLLRSPLAPYWSQGHLYLPASFLGDALPLWVGWDETTQTVRIASRSPLRSSPGVQAVAPVDYQALRGQIGAYLANRPGTYGIYLQDLASGGVLSLNDDLVFTAASTYKFPQTLLLYRLAAQGKIDLDEKMTYTQEFYEQGTGNIQGQPFGTTYTLRELAKKNIELSDNVAKNMLRHYLGRETITAYMASLGGQHLPTPQQNITSPKDMANYILAFREFLNDSPAYGWELRGYLQNTIFHDRMTRHLPPWAQVAHKIGSYNTFFHDVGLVFHPTRPYVLVLMSKDVNETDGTETLAHLSKLIWDFQSRL